MASRLKIRMGLFRLKRASFKTVAFKKVLSSVLMPVFARRAWQVFNIPASASFAGSTSTLAIFSLFIPFTAPVPSKSRLWSFGLLAFLFVLISVFSPIVEGSSLQQDDQGWVYVNDQGEPILRPFIYDNGPDYFEEGLARFVSKGKMGFHDQALKIQIPARYDFAFPFVDGYAKVGMNCKFIPEGEHRSVLCKQWESIPNPLSGSKDRPAN